MSTSPDSRPDDRLVTVLSQWLARHADDDELRRAVEEVSADELSPVQAEAVDELRAELDQGPEGRGELEMIVRETLEAVALG